MHLIVLQHDEFNNVTELSWDISAYPNPVQKVLNLYFQTGESDEFTIQVTDITGKKVLMNTNRIVLPKRSNTARPGETPICHLFGICYSKRQTNSKDYKNPEKLSFY